MHHIQFREIMRDAEVAHAIYPIVLKYHLSVQDTIKALLLRRFAACECSSQLHGWNQPASVNVNIANIPMPTEEERAEMRALDRKLDAFAKLLK